MPHAALVLSFLSLTNEWHVIRRNHISTRSDVTYSVRKLSNFCLVTLILHSIANASDSTVLCQKKEQLIRYLPGMPKLHAMQDKTDTMHFALK